MDLNINVVQTLTISEGSVGNSGLAFERREIYFIDYENGNDANSGRSWALAKKTFVNIASVDQYVAKSPDPVNLGVTGVFTDASNLITLSAALTKTVEDCDAAWTPSTNITHSTETTIRKEGTGSRKFVVGSAFTTGLAAYKALAASTDYSGYDRITFWVRSDTSDMPANYMKISLCSDVAGATPVDEFTIPFILEVGRWYPITLIKNGGGSLGSAIQSVALYFISDPVTPTVYLDNIEACNVDFHLQTLIGKNSVNEQWMSLLSIKGTAVYLGGQQEVSSHATYKRKYAGVSETVALYSRRTILLTANLATSATQTILTATTSSWLIRGGYNTSTGAKDGVTFWDGLNGWGRLISPSSGNYHTVENFGAVRVGDLYRTNIGVSNYGKFLDIWTIGCFSGLNIQYMAKHTLTRIKSWACGDWTSGSGCAMQVDIFGSSVWDDIRLDASFGGLVCPSGNGAGGIIKNLYIRNVQGGNAFQIYSEGFVGIEFQGGEIIGCTSAAVGCTDGSLSGCKFINFIIKNNGRFLNGRVCLGLSFINCEITGNGYTFDVYDCNVWDVLLSDCLIADTGFITGYFYSANTSRLSKIRIHNYNRTIGDHRIYWVNGTVKRNTGTYRTTSPSVEIARPSSFFSGSPYVETRFQAPCDSGVGRTLKLWGKCDAAWDGRSFVGVKLNDRWIVNPVKWDLGTDWRQMEITVGSGLAVENGVFELVFYVENYEALSGTSSCYLDDFEWA